MNNTITLSFCAEDRARLDRLAEALERRACDQCIDATLKAMREITDPVQMKLAEAMAKASDPAEPPKNTTEEAETSTPSTTQPEEEKPTVEENTPAEETEEPTVTLEQIQKKVTEVAAANGGKKKATVRDIVQTYAKKVSDLPEDKWKEVWDKLVALESEA